MSNHHRIHRAKAIARRKPSETRAGILMTKLMLIAGISPILIWTPQIMKVYETQDVSSLSMGTLTLYTSISALWFVYGVQKEDRPLIMSGASGGLSTLLIIAAVFVYS